MTSVNGANGQSAVLGTGYMNIGGDGGAAGFSPDALLAYCSSQMNNLDGQINSLMKQQESQLNQTQAVESVQTAVAAFGTNGPQTQAQYDQCVAAFNQAIADLPPGDPVAGQLQGQLTTMEGKYGQPSGTLTSEQQTALASAQAVIASTPGQTTPLLPGVPVPSLDHSAAYQAAQSTVASLTGIQNGTFNAPQNNDWSGTTTGLSNLDSQIKSNTQLQFLNLQNIVSQQQQAIEEATNMMSSANQTLLDQAKAV